MIDTRPLPLVPADVDLRDFPFTPIFRARLFGSEFHANATDGEWRAGVTLWLKSWDQVPAGTLPTDDIALCRLAELGRDMKTWKKLKDRALRGWRECTDGRLHHAVVAAGVLEAWGKRRSASSKGKAGASARWGTSNAPATNSDSTGNATATVENGTGNAQAMPGDGNRQGQGERRDREKERSSLRSDLAASPSDAQSQAKPPGVPKGDKRKTRAAIPDDCPTEFERTWAVNHWREKGRPDLAETITDQAAQFRDHHAKEGSRFADWPAAWRTWARNALRFTRPPQTSARPGQMREFSLEEIIAAGKSGRVSN